MCRQVIHSSGGWMRLTPVVMLFWFAIPASAFQAQFSALEFSVVPHTRQVKQLSV